MNLNMNVLSLNRLTPSTNYYPDESPNTYYVTLPSGHTIETTVTCSDSTASEWVQQITELYGSRPSVVGLAVECMCQSNKVATLHLCIERSCLILQMLHLDGIPDSIQKFLNNPNFTFVGVDIDDHMNKLFESYGLGCTDLGFLASFHYGKIFSQPRPGLRELAGVLCGWWLEDPEQTVLYSDWGVLHLHLSIAQIEYACIQAFVNFKIGKRLRFFISDSNINSQVSTVSPKLLHGFVFVGLYIWRDKVADKEHVNADDILPVRVLFELAKQKPETARDFIGTLETRYSYVDKNVEEVIHIIETSIESAAVFEEIYKED